MGDCNLPPQMGDLMGDCNRPPQMGEVVGYFFLLAGVVKKSSLTLFILVEVLESLSGIFALMPVLSFSLNSIPGFGTRLW